MIKSKLAKAVAMALATGAFSAGSVSSASASTTMYNTFNAGTTLHGEKTDGWLYSAQTDECRTCGTIVPWVGTTNGDRPYGITGNHALNWAAQISQVGDNLQISREDAVARYGVEADIDTAGGAWRDATAQKHGWAHNTDIGIFKSDVTQDITLKVQAVNGPIANFGITVFTLTGTDLGTGYTHHTAWNRLSAPLKPETTSNPFSGLIYDDVSHNTTNVTYLPDALGHVMWDNSVGNTDATAFTFRATQDQLYAIFVGGSGGTGWNQQHDSYRLSITTVPVPAALWLFGSAMGGMTLLGRRKHKTIA